MEVTQQLLTIQLDRAVAEKERVEAEAALEKVRATSR